MVCCRESVEEAINGVYSVSEDFMLPAVMAPFKETKSFREYCIESAWQVDRFRKSTIGLNIITLDIAIVCELEQPLDLIKDT